MYIKNTLEKNKGKTVEIPVNLAILLSEFLIQSSHIADEDNSQMPYPTFDKPYPRLYFNHKRLLGKSNW